MLRPIQKASQMGKDVQRHAKKDTEKSKLQAFATTHSNDAYHSSIWNRKNK